MEKSACPTTPYRAGRVPPCRLEPRHLLPSPAGPARGRAGLRRGNHRDARGRWCRVSARCRCQRVDNAQVGGAAPARTGRRVARHIQRIRQEHPDVPHRHQLQRKPEFHVITAPAGDQVPVLVIEEKDLLQLRPRRRRGVAPIRRRFVTRQELWHGRQGRTARPVTNPPRSTCDQTSRTPTATSRIGTRVGAITSEQRRLSPMAARLLLEGRVAEPVSG